MNLVRRFAREQEHGGASLLDVNVGAAGIDEKKTMRSVISTLSMVTDLPLVIDSSDSAAIEDALRFYPGRALVNSVPGEKEKMKRLIPMVKKYGAMFILLPIAGKEMPLTFKMRREIIKNIFNEAKGYGFGKKDIIVDGLALAVSCYPTAAEASLKTIEWCSKIFKANTVIGLSNISFGMPDRGVINSAFLKMAKEKGLTLAIADPAHKPLKSRLARDFLLGKDKGGLRFIKKYSEKSSRPAAELTAYNPSQKVYKAILNGDREDIRSFVQDALDSGIAPGDIMQKVMIPAIIEVGELFDQRKYFLPQLISSAETMKKGIALLAPYFKKNEQNKKGKAVILMATVKGDIHDIGKNIVALMLENHGFQILDLGKNVPASEIVRKIKHLHPDIVGLSALMTTTMFNMKEVIELSNKQGLKPKFMVGGAVVNEKYARSIGAEYAKDGVDAVRVVKNLIK